MKKVIKLFISIFLLLFILWWSVLLPVSYSNNDGSEYLYSLDGKWKLVLLPVRVTTPISLIQWFENKKYIVLFHKKTGYIGQTSPFCMMRLDFLRDDYAFFPSKDDENFRYLGADCKWYIPVNEKKWWSKIIGFISY